MFDTPALVTALMGIITSVIVGLIAKASDTIDLLSPVVKQIVVLVVAGAIVLLAHYFDLTALPTEYQGAFATVVQTLVVALTAIGSHNVQRGIRQKAFGDPDAPVAPTLPEYIATSQQRRQDLKKP